MVRWVTSDYHLGHENIIRYQNRPFANVREMNQFIVQAHNDLVKPEDHVYNLGDVTIERGGRVQREAFCKTIRSLNGHQRLFLGNHDHWPIQVYLDAGFEKIYATWRDEQNILYSHFPIHPDNLGTVVANIHGHVHSNPSPKPVLGRDRHNKPIVQPYINVSVEVTDYKPICFDDLMARIEKARNI